MSDLIASLLAGPIERELSPTEESQARAWHKQSRRISQADIQTRQYEQRRLGRSPTSEAKREAIRKIERILKYNRELQRATQSRDADRVLDSLYTGIPRPASQAAPQAPAGEDAKPPTPTTTKPGDAGEDTNLPAPPIDYAGLATKLRKAGKKLPARLVEFMADKEEAEGEQIAKHVHGDAETSDSAMWNNAKRTTDSLVALGSRLSFRFTSGRMFREISPE
jgi:hypothetical protein